MFRSCFVSAIKAVALKMGEINDAQTNFAYKTSLGSLAANDIASRVKFAFSLRVNCYESVLNSHFLLCRTLHKKGVSYIINVIS